MTIFSFYIFDRHTECIYAKTWLPNPANAIDGSGLPATGPFNNSTTATTTATTTTTTTAAAAATIGDGATVSSSGGPGAGAVAGAGVGTGAGAGAHTTHTSRISSSRNASNANANNKARSGDDAKLIFGTVFSLRNMVRKLGGEDDAFISFRTAQYKLHYYETASNLRFVMLTDTGTLSMRSVLHQIYINLWVEYVVKNPLSPVEHKGGEGVKNELFELGLDQFVRGLN